MNLFRKSVILFRVNNLILVGGYGADKKSLDATANELVQDERLQFADAETFTLRNAIERPERLEKLSRDGILVTHSLGALALKSLHGEIAVAPEQIHMLEAPTITSPFQYYKNMRNYDKRQEEIPGLVDNIRKFKDKYDLSDVAADPEDKKWENEFVIREVARWPLQFDRVTRAKKYMELRESVGKLGVLALGVGVFDQYYPSSDEERVRADYLGVPYSILDGATHDILADHPSDWFNQYFRSTEAQEKHFAN